MSDPFDVFAKPEGNPSQILLGYYASWWRSYPFSSVTFGLKYVFRTSTSEFTVNGVYTEKGWTFEVLGPASSEFVPGEYAFDLVLVRTVDGSEAVLESGSVSVKDPVSDRRTHNEVMLAKIESILMGRADSDVNNYSISSRSITKMTVKELMTWRDYYRNEVKMEKSGGKLPTLKVRFE